MLKAAILALGISVGCGQPAHAITGAQLLSLPEDYSKGFVWGAASVYANFRGSSNIDALGAHRGECLVKGKVTDIAFARSVIAYIENNPATMTQSGTRIVDMVLLEMCGFPDNLR